MKSNTRPAASDLLTELEVFLKKVARALPSPSADDLLTLLVPILGDISPTGIRIRQAFGFPAAVSSSRNLLGLLSSNEPSFRPIISICAQRIHQFLWRFKYTVKGIDAEWKEEALSKLAFLSQLCEPYLLNQRPTLVEVSSALQLKSDLKRFSESAADPTLFAVLRAFDYAEAGITVSEQSKMEMKAHALTYINNYLIDVTKGKQRIDDSSNAWWGLRLGLESGDPRFDTLVERLLNILPKPVIPTTEIKNLSLVPEIYTELRTAAYTLASIEAILEAKTSLSKDIRARLTTLIDNSVQRLVTAPVSPNLYLACVHYEGLRSYLDHTEREYLAFKIKGSVLKLSDFRPVGQFVCVDESLDSSIRELLTWLNPSSTRKKRDSVLVYGASSTGKSFLVEQLFAAFGQGAVYEERRIVCTPTVNVPVALKRVVERLPPTIPGSSAPFIFLDEVDVEFAKSIFTTVVTLLEKGNIGGTPVNDFVIFWAGGKHGSLRAFRAFLDKKQKSKQYEKGFDLFNRGKRLDLPASLIRNKNQKVLLGLAAIAKRFGNSPKVDSSVLRSLRNMPMSDKQGVREFAHFAEHCIEPSGVVCLPDEECCGDEITVEA
ncbi:MAG: hypothetical protein JWM83_1054 [Candidatus Angelobacter sp.]|nr:hypothetical protein [Candidatus Angelobacter sp.]